MNNNQEKNNIIDKVLNKIKSGEVKMKPKMYFILKTVLIMIGFLAAGLFVLFLISFIGFHLRASGVWFLPGFGLRGFRTFFSYLPWLLILIAALSIIVMETLLKRFAFVWRKPIIYSLLVVILIAFLGGFLIDKTPFHQGLFLKAREGKLPLAGPIYRDFGMPRFQGVQRGVVEEITEKGFKIRTFDDQLLTVVLIGDTQFPPGKEIKQGDSVVVMGERGDDTVQAFGVRKIEDELRPFERRLLQPPTRWK